MSDVILSQIRQRLEILYQMVDELEAGGGGGGGGTTNYNDLTNKPSINNQVLSGNKSLSDLGAATPTDITQAFAPSTIELAEGGTFPSASRSLLAEHKPINVNDDQYYFLEETGVDYLYGSMPTSGAYPSLSYLRVMKSTYAVEFHNTGIDTVPTSASDNLITSGAVYTAVQGAGGTTPTYVGAKASNFPEEYMSVLAKHLPFTTSQGLPAQDFSPWFFYSETSSQYFYIAVKTNGTTGPLLYKVAEILKSTRRWTEGAAGVLIDDRNKSETIRPTALSSTQNLDSISRGYYYTLDATNIQNSPTTDAFIIKYVDSVNNRGAQTLITTVSTNPKFYFRGRDNTGWSSWYEITGTVVS